MGVSDGQIRYNEVTPIIDIIEEHIMISNVILRYKENIKNTEWIIMTGWGSGEQLTNNGYFWLSVDCKDKAGNSSASNICFEIKSFDSEDVIIFKADYNTNSNADFAKGERKDHTGAKVTSGDLGVEGEALKCIISGSSRFAKYKPYKNIYENKGTLMLWAKPLWANNSALDNGRDSGRYLFSLYTNTAEKKFSIQLVVFKKQGTLVQIRYLKKDEKEDVHTLSIDTNQNEQERWYGNGSEKWTHLAINWDSESGQIKLYIDGELRGKQENQNWKSFNVGENSWMKVGDSAIGFARNCTIFSC